MRRITPVEKVRWSVRSIPNQYKAPKRQKTNVAFTDVLDMQMLKIISECN